MINIVVCSGKIHNNNFYPKLIYTVCEHLKLELSITRIGGSIYLVTRRPIQYGNYFCQPLDWVLPVTVHDDGQAGSVLHVHSTQEFHNLLVSRICGSESIVFKIIQNCYNSSIEGRWAHNREESWYTSNPVSWPISYLQSPNKLETGIAKTEPHVQQGFFCVREHCKEKKDLFCWAQSRLADLKLDFTPD